jgi:hypothetical protein
MVTARSPRRMVRTPSCAGPLPRVPALAVLLFGTLVTHDAVSTPRAPAADGAIDSAYSLAPGSASVVRQV